MEERVFSNTDPLAGLLVDIFLDQEVRKEIKKDLYQRIDQALELGDRKTFLQLTTLWNQVVQIS